LNALALVLLPRRWAPMPLIVGAIYITRAHGIDVGAATFTVMELLILVGFGRVLVMREYRIGALNASDHLMIAWGTWMVISALFHRDPSMEVVTRLGYAFDGWGLYFLFRAFCRSRDDMVTLCGIVGILLAPIAAAMVVEKATATNLFALFFDGVPLTPAFRGDAVRAQGPFAHSILAGSIGAVSLPLMVGLWQLRRRIALLGIVASLAMVFTSTSSGPIVSAAAGVVALLMWRYRERMRLVRWSALGAYLALEVVMTAPAYYLMARVDLTGGSTGWHRARLIEKAFTHLSEWWLVGTDYTRHWMPTQVGWSADHADITNHYLRMGVQGGLPLMLLLIAIFVMGFSFFGHGLRRESEVKFHFPIWACGASLFAHAVTCIGVSYFDQSIVFLYLTLAASGAVGSPVVAAHQRVSREHESPIRPDLPLYKLRKLIRARSVSAVRNRLVARPNVGRNRHRKGPGHQPSAYR